MNRLRLVYNRIRNYIEDKRTKRRVYEIVFQSNSFVSALYDKILIVVILLSVLLVMFISMKSVYTEYSSILNLFEYIFTVYFTIDYILRLYSAPNKKKYIFSFYGIVDFLSTFPLYFAGIFFSTQFFFVIRTFRLIGIFRIFKLFSFLEEGNFLMRSIILSGPKIIVFFLFVVIMVISIGTIMFMIESNFPNSGFNDIPSSIYWAIVTMTTVGYGDITPHTSLGKFLAAIVMLLGYTIIAVPTGVVSATMIRQRKNAMNEKCGNCGRKGNDDEATYCKYCGSKLHEDKNESEKL